jgi:hypothetical protein
VIACRVRSFAILALSLVVFALSIGAAALGAHRESLYVDPGRPDAPAQRR